MGVDDSDYKEVVAELVRCRMLIGRLRKAKSVNGMAKLERSIEKKCEDIGGMLMGLDNRQLSCLNVVEFFGDADRWVVDTKRLYDFDEAIEAYAEIETYYKEGQKAQEEEYGEDSGDEQTAEDKKDLEETKARLRRLMKD